jgi:hypothetical protein
MGSVSAGGVAMRQRTTYSKPQTLIDWKFYRLRDLFEFFSVPENEREILLWCLETELRNKHGLMGANKIGAEWYLHFSRFRAWYDGLKNNGSFERGLDALKAKHAAEVQR